MKEEKVQSESYYQFDASKISFDSSSSSNYSSSFQVLECFSQALSHDSSSMIPLEPSRLDAIVEDEDENIKSDYQLSTHF